MSHGASRLVIIVALASGIAIACGGSSSTPLTPTPPPAPAPTPPPATTTINGTITATNGGQPLAGVSLITSTATRTTDAAGSFSFTFSGPGSEGSFPVTISGLSIVTRTTRFRINTHEVAALSAFSLERGFDLNYFRQIAHASIDRPQLEPIRRWTRNPSIYIRTVGDNGRPLDPQALDIAQNTIADTIGLWTAGQLRVATFERGTETREGVAGWLTVQWTSSGSSETCGQAHVGFEGGLIEMEPNTPGCRCAGLAIDPAVIRHELGHAMGFWHSDVTGDVMYHRRNGSCSMTLSPREREYAAYMYSRPVGNADPDNDPGSTVFVSPQRIR
jgi:hypothetical protein